MSILDIESGVICQQVNCMGVMGAGLALQIKNKYPIVYEEYLKYADPTAIGKVLLVPVTNGLSVACLFGQVRYGRNRQHTNYEALRRAFIKLNQLAKGKTVYVPKNIGCGLGGGQWGIVKTIIQETLDNYLIVTQYPE